MVIGLGIDMVEVSRIERLMKNPKFLKRVLTSEERQMDLNPMRVAGRWAAKEAIAKAVGCDLTWQEVEIKNLPNGAPIVQISPKKLVLIGKTIHLSITHERGYAAAVAILEQI